MLLCRNKGRAARRLRAVVGEVVSEDEIPVPTERDAQAMRRLAMEKLINTGQELAVNAGEEIKLMRHMHAATTIRDALAAAKELHLLIPTDEFVKANYIYLLQQSMFMGIPK